MTIMKLDRRFAFGENWKSFASNASGESLSQAQRGLLRLFPNGEIADARMLDVGCGSGLSMVAALRLGAIQVDGIDVDPNSIAAARLLLTKFESGRNWSAETTDLFDLPVRPYDVVYTWGVLHHTGAMWRALERVMMFVRPGGLLAFALYRRSPACRFWRSEKKLYAAAPSSVRFIIRTAYKGAYLAAIAASGRNPASYVSSYSRSRGMSFHHDIHDWLGGYPYESAAPDEITRFLTERGFSIERSFARPVAAKGLFGSHCDEYVARSPAH
jgi:2-polyprenyl-3-methyl-5-hydroxy-6-metoxy-1,4-benzoquinol methylase